jgi:DNA-binding response OmpR family regulator
MRATPGRAAWPKPGDGRPERRFWKDPLTGRKKGGIDMPLTHVLLVDDEERFLKTTQALLEREECQVLTAVDGWQGLEQLRAKPIDVVILDVKMPGIDGIEVLSRIKTDHPLVEVIMLTGHSTLDSAISGLKLGAFDYLTKPCNIAELRLKIKAAHEKRSAMLDKIQKARIDRIISHPMEVFVKE